jgi:hypothetical protein
MTAVCPAGHTSEELDYCSVCGVAIVATGRAAPPGRPVTSAAGVTPLNTGCPVCGEPRGTPDARFCEVCRYDFIARTGGGPPAPAPVVPQKPAAPAPVSTSASSSSWLLVLTIDPSLDTEPDPDVPAPAEPERVFPVEQAEMLVGRRDDRQNIRPAIPLHDPGASRRHAKFLFDAATSTVSLHDLASTNGTKLNGQDVVSGSIRPLKDGDEVTLGRWTRIRLKART